MLGVWLHQLKTEGGPRTRRHACPAWVAVLWLTHECSTVLRLHFLLFFLAGMKTVVQEQDYVQQKFNG